MNTPKSMKSLTRIAFFIFIIVLSTINNSCKKDTPAATTQEEWCPECVGKFPTTASSYNFTDQYCGFSSDVDKCIYYTQMFGPSAGRIPNQVQYIHCNKHQ